jgi:hypothetical protein
MSGTERVLLLPVASELVLIDLLALGVWICLRFPRILL